MTDKQDKIIAGQQIKELFDLCSDSPQEQHETLVSQSQYSDEVKIKVLK